MRSMNKYGVILIGGTIGSVFAGGNCSGKKMEESDFKKFVCECFTGVTDSNFLVTLKLTDASSWFAETAKKFAVPRFVDINNIVIYVNDATSVFVGALILDKGKSLAPTSKVEKLEEEPNECSSNSFMIVEVDFSNLRDLKQGKVAFYKAKNTPAVAS